MSLTGAFQIGRTGLTAAQLGTQVTGNNLSNLATPGYSRQSILFAPARDQRFGTSLYGRGVDVLGVRRNVDTALQQRLWGSISSEQGANESLRQLSNLESTVANLNGDNVASQLSAFFTSWQQLADNPNDPTRRGTVVAQGSAIATYLQSTRNQLTDSTTQLDRELGVNVNRANDLLGQIADLNTAIVVSEGGQGTANDLRDRRDQLVTELSQYVNVTTVEQTSGVVDVLVGSTPIVLNGASRGLELKPITNPDGTQGVQVQTINVPEKINITSGKIGAQLSARGTLVNDTIKNLDAITTQLIFQLNKIYSSSYSRTSQSSYTGTVPIAASDRTLAFNDPNNTSLANLPFKVGTGSFVISVASGNGARQNVQIDITSTTTTQDVVNQINARVPGVSASYDPAGNLQIKAASSALNVSFSNDTSGVLAVLGINTFFKGTTASDISIRSELTGNPNLLNTGRVDNAGNFDDNASARLIVDLRDTKLNALGGSSILSYWDNSVQAVGVASSAAKTNADATKTVRESLDAQRTALSGVSADEEAINLVNYQRQYEASAKFISTVNDLTKTLLGLVG
jgi:flagellar hook-associated protein 1 FlgK